MHGAPASQTRWKFGCAAPPLLAVGSQRACYGRAMRMTFALTPAVDVYGRRPRPAPVVGFTISRLLQATESRKA